MKAHNDHDAGQIVFIEEQGKTRRILATWTRCGEELLLLDYVKEIVRGRFAVVGARCASREDVAEFQKANEASNSFGQWFKRSPAFMAAMVEALDDIEIAAAYRPLKRAA